MFKNYLKTAFRNLLRNRGFSLINIAGLSFGITACMLIALFVWDEKQYDKFIPDAHRIYRMYNERTGPTESYKMAGTPPMYAPTLKQEFPEIEDAVRVMFIASHELIEFNNTKIYHERGGLVDAGFEKFFPLALKYGSWKGAFDDPASIALSEDVAQKYFGKTDPIGKQVLFDRQPVTVKAVYKSDMSKFHLPLNYLVPIKFVDFPAERMQSWRWQQFNTYVKVKEGTDIAQLQAKFKKIVDEKAGPQSTPGYTYVPFMQPLLDIHLHSSDIKFDFTNKGSISYVNGLTLVALFIIIIACFNFVNLATAKSLRRAKEIGVRKSVGALRTNLISQFIGETILLVAISVLIACIITIALLPVLNEFTGKRIPYSIFLHPVSLILLVLFTFVTGILSGLYPAFVLSGFQPVKVLKGLFEEANPARIQWLRKGLVVIQFVLSGLLIMSVIIVYQQVKYLHNKDLGFNKEQILFFPMRGEKLQSDHESFKNEMINVPGVNSVALGYGFPGDMVAGDQATVYTNGEEKTYNVTQLITDHDYVKTLGIEIIAGRDFSKDIRTDLHEAFIINETAVSLFGYGTPEKAIGQPMSWDAWTDTPSVKKGKVIAVVKDFHYKSLYDKVEPTVIQIFPGAFSRVAVKMNTASVSNTISAITNIWNRYSPDYPIEYWFLDENFGKMYKSEDRLRTLLFTFTGIAIFISCLGLLGLAAYAAERRKKEIGIRKVLGATAQGIMVLLSKDFLKLVVIALFIAIPLAWFFMNKWLKDFAYRIDIDWKVFVFAGLCAIMIAILTISFQAIRAAIANPVKSLRTE